MKNLVATALTCMLCTTALADSGVLVPHVPRGAEPQIVASIVRQAFINRGWQISSEDSTSITGAIAQPRISATLRIANVNGQLIYEGSATSTGSPIHNMHGKVNVAVPNAWIRRLRFDISASLATLPDTYPTRP